VTHNDIIYDTPLFRSYLVISSATLSSTTPHIVVLDAPAINKQRTLSCTALEHAISVRSLRIEFSAAALDNLHRSETAMQSILAQGDAVYGITTGFGALVHHKVALTIAPIQESTTGQSTQITPNRASEQVVEQVSNQMPDQTSPELCEPQALNLLNHLAVGFGDWMPPDAVRAAMLLRLQTLVHGASGVRTEVVRHYAALLESSIACGCIPAVPQIGSLGASGDLIPLAHIARVLVGIGRVLEVRQTNAGGYTLEEMDSTTAQKRLQCSPVALTARDALGLVNGTSFSTAFAALAVARAERLLHRAEQLTAWLYAVMGCRRQALHPYLHTIKGHLGQQQSAASISAELAALAPDGLEYSHRPLQEVYSIRTAPQILGACRDALHFARTTVEQEIAGVDDNPVVWQGRNGAQALHGGNFQTQHIAFAADTLNAALTQAGNLVERQLGVLLHPEYNNGAPAMLAFASGTTSGLAGAQLTATALVAEMRSHCQHYAIGTLPTNGGNQDIVPLGLQAAREAYYQTERLAGLEAIYALALSQYQFLRRTGKIHSLHTNSFPQSTTPSWMPPVEPVEHDRPLHDDIRRLTRHFLTAHSTDH
jgi:histidine ammonia-lyase/tyrosine ammonia-lyase